MTDEQHWQAHYQMHAELAHRATFDLDQTALILCR
jgi:hypothetical protein